MGGHRLREVGTLGSERVQKGSSSVGVSGVSTCLRPPLRGHNPENIRGHRGIEKGFELVFGYESTMLLAPVQPSVACPPRWWMWPTILSLDAPAVVLLWQGLLAWTVSAALGTPEFVVLGCSVWLAYAADRWIEGWRLVPGTIQTHRHRFHQQWRWPLAALWAVVLCLDLATAFRGLPPSELRAGGLLLAAVMVYLFSHQLIHRNSRWRAPKEVCVAALLGAGASLFAAARPGASLHALAIPLALFVLLCFSNCALISVWENEVDRSHGQTSFALQFGRAAALSRVLPWVIVALSFCIAVAGGKLLRVPSFCACASGLLLGSIDLVEPRIGRMMARVLADVALLTPAVPLAIRHFG